ncbi:MAG TPA: hypothetical protein VK032_08780 [Burkholderiaceae bacterium]|nr:hypothetical protein [Burkholderiaceae bacterium]
MWSGVARLPGFSGVWPAAEELAYARAASALFPSNPQKNRHIPKVAQDTTLPPLTAATKRGF